MAVAVARAVTVARAHLPRCVALVVSCSWPIALCDHVTPEIRESLQQCDALLNEDMPWSTAVGVVTFNALMPAALMVPWLHGLVVTVLVIIAHAVASARFLSAGRIILVRTCTHARGVAVRCGCAGVC